MSFIVKDSLLSFMHGKGVFKKTFKSVTLTLLTLEKVLHVKRPKNMLQKIVSIRFWTQIIETALDPTTKCMSNLFFAKLTITRA